MAEELKLQQFHAVEELVQHQQEINTEQWDGSSWTEVNNLNTSRYAISQGAGIQSSVFLVYGGIAPPYTTNTEFWNGTSWTEINNLSTARGYQSQTGSATSASAILTWRYGTVLKLQLVTEEFDSR